MARQNSCLISTILFKNRLHVILISHDISTEQLCHVSDTCNCVTLPGKVLLFWRNWNLDSVARSTSRSREAGVFCSKFWLIEKNKTHQQKAANLAFCPIWSDQTLCFVVYGDLECFSNVIQPVILRNLPIFPIWCSFTKKITLCKGVN